MKKSLLLVAMCFALFVAAVPSASAQNADSEYKETLTKMLTLSGGLAAVDAMVPQIINMMKMSSPSVSEATWSDLTEKGKKLFAEKLIKAYVPMYKKYFSLDDLKQIIAFYETPVGRKLGESTPAMTMESMQMGQQIGMEFMTEMQQELDAHGNK